MEIPRYEKIAKTRDLAQQYLIYCSDEENGVSRKVVGILYGKYMKSMIAKHWRSDYSSTIELVECDQSNPELAKQAIQVLHAPDRITVGILPNTVGIVAALIGEKSHAYYFEQTSHLVVRGELYLHEMNVDNLIGKFGVVIDGIVSVMVNPTAVGIQLNEGVYHVTTLAPSTNVSANVSSGSEYESEFEE